MTQHHEFVINTGNPESDRQALMHYQQQCAASGMQVDARPNPAGGYLVSARPSGATPSPQGYGGAPQQNYGAPQQNYGAPQQNYGAPQQNYGATPQGYGAPQQNYGATPQGYGAPQQNYGATPQGYGAPQNYGAAPQPYGSAGVPQGNSPPQGQPGQWSAHPFAAAAAGGGIVAGAVGAPQGVGALVASLGERRVAYLRKVYGLLFVAVLVALLSGYLCLNLGGTVQWGVRGYPGVKAQVPVIVSLMLQYPALNWLAFAVLVGATFVASWVSKIRIVNAIAMFFVAAIMGLDLAPMIYIAQTFAGLGATLSAAPVRDAAIMTVAVFSGITTYIFITRKDFSYLGAMLTMGFYVVFGACILAIFLHSEAFSLAVASVGAILSIGFLLYVTSYIFRNSEMDDPVGDALALLVQLRNLFMFLLRILMSARD